MKTQWKRRLTQTGMVAAMVTMALTGASAAEKDPAPAAQSGSTEASATTLTMVAPVFSTASFSVGGPNLLMQPAFQRNYLKLLVGTYAPESAAEWQKALDERKKVEGDLAKPIVISSSQSKPLLSISEGIPAVSSQLNSITLSAGPVIKLSQKSEDVTFTVSAAPLELGTIEQGGTIEAQPTTAIIEAELPESFKRQQQLAEAVEADDAEAIRSLLPELLVDYRAETESLRKAAEAAELEPAREIAPNTDTTAKPSEKPAAK